MKIKEHLGLLGMKVRDRVTGTTGVVATIGFDLYGCVQAIVNPGLDKDGKPRDSLWFDIARLEVTSKKPVMDPPNYFGDAADAKKGPAERPAQMKP